MKIMATYKKCKTTNILPSSWIRDGEKNQDPSDKHPGSAVPLWGNVGASAADLDPGSGALLTRDPGWVKNRIRIRDEQTGSYFR
jgi:hypothetical protein